MIFTYDNDADALYIGISDGPVTRTQQIDEGTLVDLDASGHVLGIEVLRPARNWPLEQIKASFELGEDNAASLDALWNQTPRRYYPFAKPLQFVG